MGSGRLSLRTAVLVLSFVFFFIAINDFNWHDFKGSYLLDRNTLSSTRGRITDTSTYTSTGIGKRPKTYYHYQIEYEYSVNGKSFKSDEITFTTNYQADPNFSKRYVDYYPPGSFVTVYYDPDDPSFCVLEPEVTHDYTSSFIALTLSVISFLIFFWMIRKKKNRVTLSTERQKQAREERIEEVSLNAFRRRPEKAADTAKK